MIPVLESQRIFRSVLEAFSRPGVPVEIDDTADDAPESLGKCRAAVALALLDSNSSFHCEEAGAVKYLYLNTQAPPAEIEKAEFVFLDGDGPADLAELPSVGNLLYPEAAATLLIRVARLAVRAFEGGLELQLKGPGIQDACRLFVAGLSVPLLEAIARRNHEYPLGLDVLLSTEAQIVGIPRTAAVQIAS